MGVLPQNVRGGDGEKVRVNVAFRIQHEFFWRKIAEHDFWEMVSFDIVLALLALCRGDLMLRCRSTWVDLLLQIDP